MLKKTRSIIVMSFCLMFGHSASAVLSVALDDAELAACVADQSIGIDLIANLFTLDCNDRPLTDLTGISQLFALNEVRLELKGQFT